MLKEKKACEQCGFKDTRALEYHHPLGRDPEPFIVRVLCANCHRILHKELGKRRRKQWIMNDFFTLQRLVGIDEAEKIKESVAARIRR